ncbi:hypothetical protein EB796_009306 [Bugula neritina]|uniref:Uncharacterized protein n=1 Tax=Bugula neritina TaxID=10212 RepID=A0A7J7K2H0_BUGNE|nr:hypothetical protein EB796_009306 [Bugula neritina]
MDNAMEIVEIVNADMPAPAVAAETDVDEQAIAEIARINSINKCNVWFEAHGALLDSNTQTDTMPALNIQSNGMPEH